jgi:hypothetical protein
MKADKVGIVELQRGEARWPIAGRLLLASFVLMGITASLPRPGASAASRADVLAGGSFASSSDQRPHFGLSKATKIDKIEVLWLNGKTEDIPRPQRSIASM